MTTRSEAADAFAISDLSRAPRYMHLVSVMRDWIAQGHYPPGSQLEPEKKLGEMFGVSRITVRKAIEVLAQEGWLESRQGKGTFVQARRPAKAVRASMEQRVERARELARSSKIRSLKVETVIADDAVTDDLDLQQGDKALHVSYVRLLRGTRIGFVESYWPARLNLQVDASDFEDNTLLTLLESKGIQLSGIDHLVGATLADTRLAEKLGLTLGAPLVRVRMLMLDTDEKPVQRVLGYFRADQYEHHIFLAREGGERHHGNGKKTG